MITKAFSIFDNKAHIYYPPFYAQHLAQAVRNFEQLARDPESIISRHPEDYELVEVGAFDDATGQLRPAELLTNHGRASQYLARSSAGQPSMFNEAEGSC